MQPGIADALESHYAEWHDNECTWDMAWQRQISASIHDEFGWDSIVSQHWKPLLEGLAGIGRVNGHPHIRARHGAGAMTIEINGMKELQKQSFRFHAPPMELAAESKDTSIQAAMKRSLYVLIGEMANYPALQSNSYRRTGTLERSWTSSAKVESDGETVEPGELGQMSVCATGAIKPIANGSHRRHGWMTDARAIAKIANYRIAI